MTRRPTTAFAFTAAAALAVSLTARTADFGQPTAGASFDVAERTITDLQAAMAERRVTSRALVEASLARITAYDRQGPALNAMIALNPHALEAAEALDREREAGRVRGPLHGIPIVVKDNYETADMPTTAGSIALAGFSTGRDAFQVRKLRDAGAVIVGKTNLHELARGITTISSYGGQTRNPYDPKRNPGGSSGGTGAAVAASFGVAGMGSDTCGSIRIPAANNNLFGIRATQGLSSRSGIIPLSHTQDVGGPLARTVTDLAIVLDATVGTDGDDAATRAGDGHRAASYRDALKSDALAGARIGVVRSLFGDAPDDKEGADVVDAALAAMHARGAEVVDVPIPGLGEIVQGSSVIAAEFKFDLFDYLARFPAAPVHSLEEIVERGDYHVALEPGFRQSLAAESRETPGYRAALRKRDAVRDLIAAALDERKLDALAYPVLSRKPAIIGEPVRGMNNCQVSAATGFPAISVPAGFTPDGLPIGVELLGAAWTEPRLLALAFSYEQAAHPRRPPSTTPPLAGGRAPAPVTFATSAANVRIAFEFDPMTGSLTYRATTGGGEPPVSLAVHRRGSGETGPVLFAIAIDRAGEYAMAPADRDALEKGNLYLAVRSRGGVTREPLRVR